MMVDIETPKTTTTPIACRAAAPAPLAIIRGTAPAAVAIEVIRIGRRRRAEASRMAVPMSRPASRSWFANSTIRMPFFAARPTSITMPTWL